MQPESPDHTGHSRGHLSFAQSMWQKIHWYATECPKIKDRLNTIASAARRLQRDIVANEGNGLMQWRTRNTNTVLEIRYWNQMHDAAEELADYCIGLRRYISEISVESIEWNIVRLAGWSVETPFFLALPSHKAGMLRFRDSGSGSISEAVGEATGEPATCARVPTVEMTREPDRVKATLEPLPADLGHDASSHASTGQSFKSFAKLPVELQIMIWRRAAGPSTCTGRLRLVRDPKDVVKTMPSITLSQDYGLWSACTLSRLEVWRA